MTKIRPDLVILSFSDLTVSDCVEELDEFVVDPTETMLDKLTKIDRCLRVVENVCMKSSQFF